MMKRKLKQSEKAVSLEEMHVCECVRLTLSL